MAKLFADFFQAFAKIPKPGESYEDHMKRLGGSITLTGKSAPDLTEDQKLAIRQLLDDQPSLPGLPLDAPIVEALIPLTDFPSPIVRRVDLDQWHLDMRNGTEPCPIAPFETPLNEVMDIARQIVRMKLRHAIRESGGPA